VLDRSRGWYVRVEIQNAANYTHFIHAPGNPGENVVRREILDPLDVEIERLRVEIPAVIKRTLEGG
jgi:hypothetical protein